MNLQDFLCSTCGGVFWGELGKLCVEVKDRPWHAETFKGIFRCSTLIFKRRLLRCQRLYGRPVKAAVGASDDGWMNGDLFLERSQMFTEQLAKTDDPRPHVIPGNTMSTIWTLYNRCDDLSKHGLQPADRALGEKKKKKKKFEPELEEGVILSEDCTG